MGGDGSWAADSVIGENQDVALFGQPEQITDQILLFFHGLGYFFFRGLFLFRDWGQLFKHGIDAFAGIIGRPGGNGHQGI